MAALLPDRLILGLATGAGSPELPNLARQFAEPLRLALAGP
jgi:hypothetical protein